MALTKWRDATVLLLIEEIRLWPELTDKRNDKYKDERHKKAIWEGISRNIGETVECSKAKWRNMKDTYMKRKRCRESPTGSAALANGTFIETWQFWDAVDSMLGSTQPANTETVNNMDLNSTIVVDSDAVSEEYCEDTISTPSPGSAPNIFDVGPQQTQPKRRKVRQDTVEDDPQAAQLAVMAGAVTSFLQNQPGPSTPKEAADDAIEGYTKLAASMLKQVPYAHRHGVIVKLIKQMYDTVNEVGDK